MDQQRLDALRARCEAATPEEIAALRTELDAFKADIEAGRLVRLEPCDECRYKLESQAWEYYTYPCRECRQRTKSHFARAEAARAALEGGQHVEP